MNDEYQPRLIKIGRLYFKYIRNSELERQGLTAENLAHWMQTIGLIEIVGGEYRERVGQPNRRELRRLYQLKKGAA
jgi:hypothetical protein